MIIKILIPGSVSFSWEMGKPVNPWCLRNPGLPSCACLVFSYVVEVNVLVLYYSFSDTTHDVKALFGEDGSQAVPWPLHFPPVLQDNRYS